MVFKRWMLRMSSHLLFSRGLTASPVSQIRNQWLHLESRSFVVDFIPHRCGVVSYTRNNSYLLFLVLRRNLTNCMVVFGSLSVSGGMGRVVPDLLEKELHINYTFASRANILSVVLSMKKINHWEYIINKDIWSLSHYVKLLELRTLREGGWTNKTWIC